MIFVLPNLGKELPNSKYNKAKLQGKYSILPSQFVIAYTGNLTFDYTTSGVEDLIAQVPSLIKSIPNIQFLIAGDGDGLALLQEAVGKNKLENHVRFTGRIADVYEVLAISNVAIIPWKQNELSETILPTKVLEYMAFGIAIVAPAFGEFKNLIQNGKTGLLYSNTNELSQKLLQLYSHPEQGKVLAENARTFYLNTYNKKELAGQLRTFLNTP
jgi:glycosyltransferase involved in cell wall biosynthesis